MIVVYTYRNCSTCRKAIQWLRENEIGFIERPIRETPPSEKELRQVLDAYEGDTRRLFNTSGQDYRAQNMKERFPGLETGEALRLLSQNGNLVKRPFLLTETSGRAGFKEAEWQVLLQQAER